MQYTLPYLMYAFNHLSIHSYDPSSPNLQGIKYLIGYLPGFPNRPIMYPTVLYGTTTHELHQEVALGDFHSQKISNCLLFLADGGEVCVRS